MLHMIEKWVDLFYAHRPQPQPTLKQINQAQIVAHRGAHDDSLSIQENTHPAFERAITLGCAGIEFDVHATADGVIVVNHDPTLRRLWGHDVAIEALEFDALRRLIPTIPTLEEMVNLYGKRVHLFIELKSPFTATKQLADTLSSLKAGEDYHLLCLEAELFPLLTNFPKSSLLLVPVHHNVSAFCNISVNQSYGGVLGHYLLLRNKHIQQLQAANQTIGVGFVDSKNSLYRELNRDLPYLFTNNAKTVMQCLKELSLAPPECR